jgi:hypothetical protein
VLVPALMPQAGWRELPDLLEILSRSRILNSNIQLKITHGFLQLSINFPATRATREIFLGCRFPGRARYAIAN